MIAALNNQSILMLAIGCVAILAYVAVSPRYRPLLPSYSVAICGLLLLGFGMKDASALLVVLGLAGIAVSIAIFFARGGTKYR